MCGNKNKINCQCDGNCDCGEILPNGMISCDNCGWEAKEKYNAITGRFTCPSCRTEKLNLDYYSNYSNNSNKNNQMTNNDNFTQGLVGFATANPGFLEWSENPLGKPNGNNESNFADDVSSQNVVGYAIGQQWMPMNPIHGQEITESNYRLGQGGLRSAFIRFTPAGILIRESFCGKYCKALGYMRSVDKNSFKRCKAACKVNYIAAKDGKWKYPAAPEGAESDLSPEELAAQSKRDVDSMSKDQIDNAARNVASQEGSTPIVQPEKNNTMMYVIIGAVALVIIVALIVFMRRKAATA